MDLMYKKPTIEEIPITFLIEFVILLNVQLRYVSAVPNLMLCDIVKRSRMVFIFMISMSNVTLFV